VWERFAPGWRIVKSCCENKNCHQAPKIKALLKIGALIALDNG
jgi:hypothetical protein